MPLVTETLLNLIREQVKAAELSSGTTRKATMPTRAQSLASEQIGGGGLLPLRSAARFRLAAPADEPRLGRRRDSPAHGHLRAAGAS